MSTHTFDLTQLPRDGHVKAFVIGTRVNFDEAEDGIAEQGWVDPRFSSTTLFESRNDVNPVFAEWVLTMQEGIGFDTSKDIVEHLREAIRRWVGHVDHVENGVAYPADSVTHDYTTADTWQYEVVVYVRHRDMRGVLPGDLVETPVQFTAEWVNGR